MTVPQPLTVTSAHQAITMKPYERHYIVTRSSEESLSTEKLSEELRMSLHQQLVTLGELFVDAISIYRDSYRRLFEDKSDDHLEKLENILRLLHQDSQESMASRMSLCEDQPKYTYRQLIIQAIMASPNKELELKDIYDFVEGTYPYHTSVKTWKQNLRRVLDQRGEKAFKKYSGSTWGITPCRAVEAYYNLPQESITQFKLTVPIPGRCGHIILGNGS